MLSKLTKPIKRLEGLGSQKQCIYAGWVGPQDLLRSVPGNSNRPSLQRRWMSRHNEKQTRPAAQNPGILPQILDHKLRVTKKKHPKNPNETPKKIWTWNPKNHAWKRLFSSRQMGDEFQKTSLPPFVFRAKTSRGTK